MKLARMVSVGAGLMLAAAGCAPNSGNSDGGDETAEQDSNAPIEVWVDEVRTPGAEAFADAHPDLDIKINTVPNEPGYMLQQVGLKNQAGDGWPDVVFLNTPEDIASLADPSFDEFAQPLNDLVEQDVLDGFADGTLRGCTFDSEVYCLRNDIGQTLLWYNQKLMSDFGYDVPTTWTEYKEIGEGLAQDHPGYVVGSLNGKWGAGTFFSSSGCETRATEGLDTVRINVETPECQRVVDVLEPLIDNKTLSLLATDDDEFAKLGKENKILMLPGPSWYGAARLQGNLAVPAGQWAAAPMPTWDGESEAFSGSVGGGAWVVSRHSKNLEAAAEFAAWMATSPENQVGQVTYPAYEPVAAEWGEALAADKFYAEDPFPVMQEMAPRIRDTFGWVRYANEWNETFNQTIAALDRNGPLADALTEWGSRLESAATETDYQVVQ